MHTISRQFIPLIYGPLGKRILPNIQPTLPFLWHEVMSPSSFTGLNFENISGSIFS